MYKNVTLISRKMDLPQHASASKGINHSPLLCCKFTWRIYALSERLLVIVSQLRCYYTSKTNSLMTTMSITTHPRCDCIIPMWSMLRNSWFKSGCAESFSTARRLRSAANTSELRNLNSPCDGSSIHPR